MKKKSVIFLVGFMGCGKSTVGRRLARLLKWSFADLDTEIEKTTGLSVAEVFSSHGEDFFREIEAKTLRTIALKEKTVVSTGGGTPCFCHNMEFMNETGHTVYLMMTPQQLCSRLKRSANRRPLLANLSQEELFPYVAGKLAERKIWYEMAELYADAFNVDIKRLVTACLQACK